MTPQYGHSGVGGTGGNDNLLFTRTDLARLTSVVDLAYKDPTAVCRAVVAFVTGTGGGPASLDSLLILVDFAGTLEAKRTVGALSFILGR